ncbi:MAG: DNA methylase [Alloprevotella sp.]
MKKPRTYIAIDLKSFYASVECVERGLDPLTTNLVVADESRTEKTICLAVSPSLKAYGIGGRARLFEVVQRMKEVNALRRSRRGGQRFTGKSWDDTELRERPDLEIDYIRAMPRMAFYIDYSTRIYRVYLKYVSAEDIHVYSIDEVFMDVTNYLGTYKMTAHELAMTIVRDVLKTTGITATAGIGTNLYLAKVAMDIVAKHLPADEDGVRIAELDEMSYRRLLWNHRPLTDFWRIGHGIADRLAAFGLDTMGKIARCSLLNEELFYRLFGVNAELLIDHAWGWEPCSMAAVKAYRPRTHSLSSGQVLTCPYTPEKALVVLMEMADGLALDLLDKGLTTNHLVLYVGYDTQSLTLHPDYDGEVTTDRYGRKTPKHAGGRVTLEEHTSSSRIITEAVVKLFRRLVNPDLLIRRVNLTVAHLMDENAEKKKLPVQLDLFTDYEELRRREQQKKKSLEKERKMQKTVLALKKRFGKNAILKGVSFREGATARERNQQIGGHKA